MLEKNSAKSAKQRLIDTISDDHIEIHFANEEVRSDTGCTRAACRKLWYAIADGEHGEQGFPFSFQKAFYDKFSDGGVPFSQNTELFQIIEEYMGAKVSNVFQRDKTPMKMEGKFYTKLISHEEIDYLALKREQDIAGMLFLVRKDYKAGHTVMFVNEGDGEEGYGELKNYLEGQADEWLSEAIVFFEK